jgi:endonuclease G
VFLDGEARFMKGTDIRIPDAFYKVALDLSPPMKMIAFIVPNRASKRPIRSFVVTVDEVEAVTGMNFFDNLEDRIETELEKHSDITEWQIDTAETPPPPAPRRRKKTKTAK